jgi:hypothetical protein
VGTANSRFFDLVEFLFIELERPDVADSGPWHIFFDQRLADDSLPPNEIAHQSRQHGQTETPPRADTDSRSLPHALAGGDLHSSTPGWRSLKK